MARRKKIGLDFYYKDVHEMDDFRVMNLMERFGAVGYVVLDMTMSCVYRNGYYLEMPIAHLASYIYRYVAGSSPIKSSDVAEIIRYCGELGLFDRELLSRGVITSVEIQEHYSCVAARRRVEKAEYWLLPQEEKFRPSSEKTAAAPDSEIIAAEMPVKAPENAIDAAAIPQSKENKSKENKTKQNESKAKQSKAKQSKANKSRRASADEIFCADECCREDEGCQASSGCFADASADAAADAAADAGYGEIESAFYQAAGKKLKDSDREEIEMILSEGADEGMIISAINKAVSRRNRTRINSFRYFLPMIRETLREESDGLRHGSGGSPPIDDGFIHSGCIDDEVLAGCMSEEDLMTALDRELGHDPGWDSAPVDYSE